MGHGECPGRGGDQGDVRQGGVHQHIEVLLTVAAGAEMQHRGRDPDGDHPRAGAEVREGPEHAAQVRHRHRAPAAHGGDTGQLPPPIPLYILHILELETNLHEL